MKKGLTLLLAVVMLMTAAAANVSAAAFADTEGTSCETAVDVLSALGIVEGKEEGVYAPEDSLTRAEMATIVLRLMKMESTAAGQDIFTDVPSSHWAYANITAAYQLGIVNGTSETTFNPDDAVTYEQAVKMVVAALGYTVQAEALGGYPSGYLSKAAQLDLLAGVKTGGEMTRGNMAILVYNALDVELFTKTTYGDEAYEYVADESKTLLSYHLKVTKITDTVTGTYLDRIGSLASRRLLTDEVSVGSLILKEGETNASYFFGVRCDIYYKKDAESDIPVIQAIIPRSSVEVIDVNAKDIIAGSTTPGLFVYETQEGKEEEVAIGGAVLVYNGRETAKDTAHLVPAIGTVRLILEGTDCKTILVQAYKNYVVDTVIVEKDAVYCKDGTELTLDFSDASVPIVMSDADGVPISLVDLMEWDVISVRESEGADRTYRIYRASEMVAGKVTEISGEDIRLDDTLYPMHSPLAYGTAELGQAAAYYLDFTGTVAAVDMSYETGKTYGWLAGAAVKKGLDGAPQLKIFTQDGEMKVFDTTDTVRLNGQSVDKKALLSEGTAAITDFGVAPALYKEGAVVPQLLRYKTNADGTAITEIETAANRTNMTTDADKIGNDFSMDWYYDDQRHSAEFNNTAKGGTQHSTSQQENMLGIYFTRVIVGGDTKLFVIPVDQTKDAEYSIRALSSFGFEENRDGACVSFYDVDENYFCGAMVMHNYLSNTNDSAGAYPSYTAVTPAIVTGMSTVLSEDGEIQNRLNLYNSSGKEVSVIVEEDFSCTYRTANARLFDEGDEKGDPDWYTSKDADGTKLRDAAMIRDLETTSNNRSTVEMFLDVADLDNGDIIQYKADAAGNLTIANVSFRANYPMKVEYTARNNGVILGTSQEHNYNGAVLYLCGTVKMRSDDNVFVETQLVYKNGTPNGTTVLRALQTRGKWVLWDKEKQTMREITSADVIPGDEVFAYWRTSTQQLVVVYR